MDRNSGFVDLLHPLTTLEWKQCCEVTDNLTDAQAAVLGDVVYVGGWDTHTAYTRPGSLLIYDVTGDSWVKCIETPTKYFALTTYRSKLVLVGGKYLDTLDEPFSQSMGQGIDNKVTNKLWVLDEQQKLNSDCLPAMPTAHMCASAISKGSHLVVAGGCDGRRTPSRMLEVGVVEVYNGHVWERAQSLPIPDSRMKSIFHEGNWFLNGRFQTYTSLDSLIATTSSDKPDEVKRVWKELTDLDLCAPTMFGNQLVDIKRYSSSDSKGFSCTKSALHIFSPLSNQWICVGDLPIVSRSTCMLLLPTRELLVVVLEAESYNRPRHIFRGSVRVGPFRTGHISLSVLERLQKTAGIDIINQLAPSYRDFVRVVPKELPDLKDYKLSPTEVCEAAFRKWNLTWGMLLIVLRALSMNKLATKIERFFKTGSARSAIAGGTCILPIEGLGREEQSEEEKEETEEEEDEEKEGQSLFSELHSAMRTAGLDLEVEESQEIITKLEKLKGNMEEREGWLKDCESSVQSLMELRLKDQQQIETLRAEADELKKQLESVEEKKASAGEKRSMDCDQNAAGNSKRPKVSTDKDATAESEPSNNLLDTQPTLPVLLKFPSKSGMMNIPQMIGTKYETFGILLLNDKQGEKIDAIIKEKAGPYEINMAILKRWLHGEGEQPVTWRTLIQVLKDSELNTLAHEIEDFETAKV